MQILHSHCAGLDLHKRFLIACVRCVDLFTGEVTEQSQRFGTLPDELDSLAQWLSEHGVTHVAMESTGVLWRPVHARLEPHFQEVAVVNAQHLKRVPGRKTDVLDSQWLAQLYQVGLVQPSFIPAPEFREVRELTRDRAQLIADRARVSNRIGKVLESAGVKLASVVSDILGASGRAMLEALVEGRLSAEQMADLARGRLREKRADLVRVLGVALTGGQRFALHQHLLQWDALSARIEAYHQEIARRLAPYEQVLARLDAIPGVNRQTAEVLVAELGADVTRFPSPGHLCSWAGLCPGQRESGGKQGSGKTRPGNRWLRGALVQSAWAATRKNGSWLRARYYALKSRRGGKRAALAVARALLEVVWYLLADPEAQYRERPPRQVNGEREEAQTRKLVKRLEALGHQVSLAPLAHVA